MQYFIISFCFLADLKTKAHLQGEIYEKDGVSYIHYNSLELKVHIGGGKVRLSNLFGGDKILSKFKSVKRAKL